MQGTQKAAPLILDVGNLIAGLFLVYFFRLSLQTGVANICLLSLLPMLLVIFLRVSFGKYYLNFTVSFGCIRIAFYSYFQGVAYYFIFLYRKCQQRCVANFNINFKCLMVFSQVRQV